MARLTWRSVLSSGSVSVGDTQKNRFLTFNLSNPPRKSAAALLILAAANVDTKESFLTINMPNQAALDDISFKDAKSQKWFVSRIFRTASHYTTQIHRIPNGLLKNGSNHLGIHTRNTSGRTSGNLDDFKLARIFVAYTTGS